MDMSLTDMSLTDMSLTDMSLTGWGTDLQAASTWRAGNSATASSTPVILSNPLPWPAGPST